jgi:branched-chain amino acid transport system permease protein
MVALVALVCAAVVALIACASPRGNGLHEEDSMDGKTVSVMGKELHYVENGSGSPVVLVHGNTGSSRWWGGIMDLPGHRVIALDLPNFGRSDALEVADIDVYADHLAAFIAALGLVRPAVVGHSLGGAVVMSMAARNPELAAAVVLVDSGSPAGLKTPEEHYPYIEMFRTNRAMMRQALAAVAPTMKDDALLDVLTDDAMRMAPIAFSGNARALERFNYVGRAGAFKGPVLVIWGRKDSIITEAMARETAAEYPDASLEILEGVGHSVMVEAPGELLRLLSGFLEERI